MDATVIVDYGQHTVKHGMVQHKRASGARNKQAQIPKAIAGGVGMGDQTSVFAVESKDSNCKFNMNVSSVASHISSIVEGAGVRGSSFTLSFLTNPMLCLPAKELLVQCLFEEVKPQRIFLGYSAVCALFASGSTSSLVVDFGHFRTTVVPVWQGVPLTHQVVTTFHGGSAVDAALVALLHKQHHVPADAITPALLHSIKSFNCFVPHHNQLTTTSSSSPVLSGPQTVSKPLVIPLPDGQTVRVPMSDHEYAAAGRCLFDSTRDGEPSPLHAAVDCARSSFLENENICRSYLATGGPSMMRGACEMLGTVLNSSCLSRPQPHGGDAFMQRRSLKDRDTAGWSGASILSHLSTFSSMCIDAATYAEEGPRRCLKVKTVDGR